MVGVESGGWGREDRGRGVGVGMGRLGSGC